MSKLSVSFRSATAVVVTGLCLFASTPLHAQYENGSLLGTIRDASGAPIPGADVAILNTATGIATQTKTDATGNYDVPELKVGTYTVTAAAPGFSKAVAEKITVSVGNRQHIDLSLKVGATETSIEVSDVALQLETETSQRDQTITNYQTEAFPLVTRNYSDLLGLVTGTRQAPTAATTSSINSLARAGAYNVNGLRSMFNNFLLDGMDNNAYGESNQGFDNQIIAIPPDSVAQFSVVTNNESAEYGRSAGATINVASASGSNQFHATLYEFIRNTALNAPGFFKPTQGNVPFRKPTFNRNQFGANVSGPIFHDKFFFFLDYEGFRQVLKPLSVLTLPTQNELNGIFVVPVYNPATNSVCPAGQALSTCAGFKVAKTTQQIATDFINSFHVNTPASLLPVSGAATSGLATNNYAVQVPFTDNSDKGDLRLDYQQNSSNSWFLRVSDRKENAVNSPSLPIPLDGQTNGNIRVLDQQVALGYTHLFGTSKVLDARLGLSRTKAGKYNLSIGDPSFNYIPGLPTNNPIVAGGLPSIGITNFTGFGRQSTNPQWQNPALLDPKVNFTWVRGNHSFKLGYEFERIWMAVNDNNPLYGSFTFGGGYSACPAGTVVPATSANPGGVCSSATGTPTYLSSSKVADTYFADFLLGDTSAYSLANYFVVHLR